MDLIIGLAITAGLLLLGLIAGGTTERRHFCRLARRKEAYRHVSVSQMRSFPDAVRGPTPPMIIVGEAVIATDYLKTFLATLRKLFGGEMRSYQSLLVRARAEALQRVVERAYELGFNAICNVRYETADISGNATSRRRAAMVAIMASATAYHRPAAPA